MSNSLIWLILAVALALIELATMGLVTIWFAVGAIIACLSALVGVPLIGQLVIFAVVSTVILVVVRPLANKYINSKVKKTNIDALAGRRLIAKTDIDNIKRIGKVDVDGSTWMAASDCDEITINAGEEVEIVKVVGATIIVKRV